jgi:hypothetical protein
MVPSGIDLRLPGPPPARGSSDKSFVIGKGAFRRFKDELHQEHPHLLPAWYAFRDARGQRRAVDWLVDNSLIDGDTAARFVDDHPDPDVP